MDEGVTVELKVIDRVKDCPPCPHLELRFEYETGMSANRSWKSQTWVARCIHEGACGLRRRDREGADDGNRDNA